MALTAGFSDLLSPRASGLLSRGWFVGLVRGAAALALLLVVVALGANSWKDTPLRSDFLIFMAAAKSWFLGESLFQGYTYSPLLKEIVFAGSTKDFLVQNFNAPIVSLLAFPLPFFTVRTAYYLWVGTQFLGGLLLSLALASHILPRHPLRTPGVILFFSLWFPVFCNLLIGQMGLFLYLALGGGWLALRKQREALAGVFFGLALLLKPFVGLLFIWLLLQRRWRLLFWGSGMWGVGMALGLLLFGVQDHLNWLTVLREQGHTAQSWNGSLQGFLSRYFGGGLWSSPLDWPWMRWAVRSLALIASAGALIALSRRPHTFETGIALVLPLMLFLSPYGWIYYFPILLISVGILYRQGVSPYPLILVLMLAGVPQPLAKGDNLMPTLHHSHYALSLSATVGEQVFRVTDPGWNWFVFPDVYPAALLLLSVLAVRAGGVFRRRGDTSSALSMSH